MADFKPLIAKVAAGTPLTRAESREAFNIMMSGEATPSQIAGFLMALRVRGETVDEITGAVEVMREKMTRVDAPAHAIDIVGTGGDASGSYNISTCAAFITAGTGLPVAKHGNRALSSKSGAADVLMALGIKKEFRNRSIFPLFPRSTPKPTCTAASAPRWAWPRPVSGRNWPACRMRGCNC